MTVTSSKGWAVLSASVSGSTHLARGLECQDAHVVSVLADGTLLAAVCDGAGSARRAAEGATVVAQETVKFLVHHLSTAHPSDAEGWKCLLAKCVQHARSFLVHPLPCSIQDGKIADANNSDVNVDLATTLLLIAVTDQWFSAIQIGDGAIVTRNVSRVLSVQSIANQDEYINETTFITSPDYLKRAHCIAINDRGLDGVALCSDGMQLLSIEYVHNTAHAPFFSPLFDFAAQPDSTNAALEEFLQSERVCERTDDDKTLVLAVRM